MLLLHEVDNESWMFSSAALSNNGMHPIANSIVFIR